MKRFSKTLTDRFHNQGDIMNAIPTYRREVIPNQTVRGQLHVKMETAAMTENVMWGGLFQTDVFYVPFRLVWDDWIKFITRDDDYLGSVPTTSTAMQICWENAGTHRSFFRRSMKRVFNTYYGSEPADDSVGTPNTTFYQNPDNDADVSMRRLMSTEEWAKKVWWSDELVSPTYDATTTPIDMVQFLESLGDARQFVKRRTKTTSGNAYVDMLRSFGVNASEQIINLPVKIGKGAVTEVEPRRTVDTTGANIGQRVAKYEAKHTVSFNVNVPEHGYLMALSYFRPHLFNPELESPWEELSRVNAVNDADLYFQGENETGRVEVAEAGFTTGIGADKITFPKHLHLFTGQHLVNGAGQDFANTFAAANHYDAVFPPNTTVAFGTGEMADDVAFASTCRQQVILPIRKNEVY